jgi:hypothetical protein
MYQEQWPMTPDEESLFKGSAIRRQYLIMLLLTSLSLLLVGNIVRLVEAAAPCYTKDGAAKEGALVAPSLAGLKEALSIIGSGDAKAYNQLLEQKRVRRLPGGIPVFIEESFELYHRIRPQGMIESVWTASIYLICPKKRGIDRR